MPHIVESGGEARVFDDDDPPRVCRLSIEDAIGLEHEHRAWRLRTGRRGRNAEQT
jgi:hypothetical protein